MARRAPHALLFARKYRRGVLLIVCLGLTKAALAGAIDSPTPPTRHSFLEPIDDFVRDDIWKPAAPFQLVPDKDPNGWSIVVEPYVWAMGLTGGIGVKGMPPAQLNFSSRTVLQSLDWGIFARGEVRKGRWGLLADGYYAALSGSGSLNNKIYDTVSLAIQQSLVSLALAYRIIDDRRGFLDIYAGARYNYIGGQVDASLNDSRIDAIGTSIADGVAEKVRSALEAGGPALLAEAQAAIVRAIKDRLPDRIIDRQVEEDRSLRSLVRDRAIRDSLGNGKVREVLAEYVRALVQAKQAAAKGELTAKLQAAADAAKKKLGQAVASRIKEAAPTDGAGNQWWFDPIIGLRGQVNVTRWLFLAAQGDVGGFGAGSQIAWNVQATIGVNVTRNIFAEIGYRYMYVDYANDGFLYNMNSYGLYSGMGVKF